jgi:hypothetical protein
MNICDWLTEDIYLPKWLYKFWYKRIYTRSHYWYALRLRVKARYKAHGAVEIHHVTYEWMGKPQRIHFIPFIGKRFITGYERLSDLRPLTRAQHQAEHKARR